MTDVEARSFTSRGDPLHEPSFQENIESRAETIEDFESLWSDLVASMDEVSYEEDPESRLTTENVAKAYASRLAFPNKVTVTREPLGRNQDLDDHVQHHFRTLVNERDRLRRTMSWDDDDLLDACELVYIDDAVFRFVTVTIFEPEDEDLASARFNKYPDEATEWMVKWMEKVDITWRQLTGEMSISATGEEFFGELRESKDRFVAEAREADVFLPITNEAVSDVEDARRNIKRRIRRGSPSSGQIHRYCYSRLEERV